MDAVPPRRTAPPLRKQHTGSSLVIRNVVVGGHRTSVRLEPTMWDALADIARHSRKSLHQLVTEIEQSRTASSLTAAIRVFIVEFYRSAAAQGGLVPVVEREEPPGIRL